MKRKFYKIKACKIIKIISSKEINRFDKYCKKFFVF